MDDTLVRGLKQFIFLFIGALIFAIGIDLFLVPNQVIDGGVVGISIIVSYLTGWNFGLLLIVFNMPFLFLGYKRLGKKFAISTALAIVFVAVFSNIIHKLHVSPITEEPMLAAVFGGMIIGVGVGIIIRYGKGSMDGTEIMALVFNQRSPFSVGEIVMFFNVFILLSAGFVFGWDRAMYSLIAYFVAFKAIDLTIEGLDETRQVFIISDYSDEIGEALLKRMNRGVTYLKGAGGFTGADKKIIFCICTRLEESQLKMIVEEVDQKAFLAIGHIHDVRGGQFRGNHLH